MNQLKLNIQANKDVNRIINEQLTLNHTLATKVFTVTTPLEGPFFSESFEASILTAGVRRTLVKDTDYTFGLLYEDAKIKSFKDVHTCIVFTGVLSGLVSMNYTALGGNCGLTSADVTTISNISLSEAVSCTLEKMFYNVTAVPAVNNIWAAYDLDAVKAMTLALKKNGYLHSIVKK